LAVEFILLNSNFLFSVAAPYDKPWLLFQIAEPCRKYARRTGSSQFRLGHSGTGVPTVSFWLAQAHFLQNPLAEHLCH
jgi:hypothetical protein